MSDKRTSEIPDYICMICDEERFDADEAEPDPYRDAPEGYEAWLLWVYCRRCDCWTEHPYLVEKRPLMAASRRLN